MKSEILQATDVHIARAAEIIQRGRLVAFPTETVYGLGANALSGEAVAKIFEAKGRPQFNPLITHFLSLSDIELHAQISEMVEKLAHYFWPGALTMILPRKSDSLLSDLVSAGLPSIAVRIPANKVARKLLKQADVPIAAPSANVSGSVSATTPSHVADGLGGKVDIILADGACEIGLESTVIDMSGDIPVILRPGSITPEEISNVLGIEVSVDLGDHDAPKSPGQLLKHYAPGIPVRLNAIDLEEGEALLAFGSDKFIGIKSGGAANDLPDSMRKNLSDNKDLYEAASNLFAMLRALDKPEHKAIAVMNIPENGIGLAINDRLRRAANG